MLDNFSFNFISSDRIRTTNNMLGDCYAAAVVEELSRKELMALDAAVLYQVNNKVWFFLFFFVRT